MSCAVIEKTNDVKMLVWFENLIQAIKIDELKLQTNTADNRTKKMYEAFMSDDIFKAMDMTSKELQKVITSRLFNDFLEVLFQERKADVSRIAFDLSGQQILVWAVVKEDDELTEEDIYLAESCVNSRYREHNYSVFATVVEECDNVPIPKQYRELMINKDYNA